MSINFTTTTTALLESTLKTKQEPAMHLNVNTTLPSQATPMASLGPAEESPTEYHWAVLLMFIVIAGAIGGNLLVCLAVKKEPKLRNMFNYFLVSLALSDLLTAILVMPFSVIKAFTGLCCFYIQT